MLELIIAGKYLMYPLLLCSVVTLAIIIDRMAVFKLASKDTLALREQVNKDLHHDHFHKAVQACEDFGGPIAAVLLIAIRRYEKLHRLGKSPSEIEAGLNKIVTDYAPHVLEALEKRIHILMLIAGVAPLLGMTGTCTGMISSFTQMADAGVGGQAVASGISEALITTATGLIVAIPALVFHNIFTRKIDQFVLDVEDSATGLIDYVTLDHVSVGTHSPKENPVVESALS